MRLLPRVVPDGQWCYLSAVLPAGPGVEAGRASASRNGRRAGGQETGPGPASIPSAPDPPRAPSTSGGARGEPSLGTQT